MNKYKKNIIYITISITLILLLLVYIYQLNSIKGLERIYYNSDYSISYHGKNYYFIGSAKDIKKGSKLAYIEDEQNILTEIREIKNYSSDEWLLTISKSFMGDWAVYREENVTNLPLPIINSSLYKYDIKQEYDGKIYQFFCCGLKRTSNR